MVSVTTGAMAAEAGLGTLKKGGSAADAAMATAMVQVCEAAGAWVSYAGVLTMVYFDAASGKTYNLNAAYNTVKGETDPRSIPGVNMVELVNSKDMAAKVTASGRTALVPGFMAGVEAAHARFGKLSLTEIFDPAIHCAEQGFPYDQIAAAVASRKDVLARLPETQAVFNKPGGVAYAAGDTFRQPVLAETLRKAATVGINEYFYRGPWAEKFVAAVQGDGGKMTLDDLAAYRVLWSEPVHGEYRGYDIYAHGQPASGGISLIEAMRLADRAELSDLGPYSSSPLALYWLTQIAKPATLLSIDAVRPLYENAIGSDLSLESRLKVATTAKLWDAIKTGRMPHVLPPKTMPPAHSDGVVVVDQWGNMAAVVHTINTVNWGWTGIFVDGISIPDSAAFQQEALAQVQPGSRFPDQTSPGLVTKDGKPFMAFSAIGSGLHIRTIAALISVLDFGLKPQEAINEHSLGFFTLDPRTGEITGLNVGANEFPETYKKEISDLGLTLTENGQMRGYWIGVQVDKNTGTLYGGAARELKHRGGRAIGY